MSGFDPHSLPPESWPGTAGWCQKGAKQLLFEEFCNALWVHYGTRQVTAVRPVETAYVVAFMQPLIATVRAEVEVYFDMLLDEGLWGMSLVEKLWRHGVAPLFRARQTENGLELLPCVGGLGKWTLSKTLVAKTREVFGLDGQG